MHHVKRHHNHSDGAVDDVLYFCGHGWHLSAVFASAAALFLPETLDVTRSASTSVSASAFATLAWASERFVGATVVCLVVVSLLGFSFLRTTLARGEAIC